MVLDKILDWLTRREIESRPKSPDLWIPETLKIAKGEKQGKVEVPCALYFDAEVEAGSLIYNYSYGGSNIDPKDVKQLEKLRKRKVELIEKKRKLGRTASIVLLEKVRTELRKVEVEIDALEMKLGLKKAKKEYKFCPSFAMSLHSPAKTEIAIPVLFGIKKSDLQSNLRTWLYFNPLALLGAFAFVLFVTLVNFDVSMLIIMIILGSYLMLYPALKSIALGLRVKKWFNSVRSKAIETSKK